MKIISTTLDNVYLIEEPVHEDNRGYFMETWNETSYSSKSLINDLPGEWAAKDDGTMNSTYFVQDNLSISHKGVFRGLHYQTPMVSLNILNSTTLITFHSLFHLIMLTDFYL